MKNIVFVFNPGCMPVPAIDGGAVEALVTNLIRENEVKKKFHFHIIMCKHSSDKRNFGYEQYKHTSFYDYYQSDLRFKINRIVNGVNKRTNYAFPIYSLYERFILKTIKGINPDYVVFEGSFNAIVRKLKKILKKEQLVLHVHHRMMPKFKLDKHFGCLLCVSEYVKKDWIESGKITDANFQFKVLPNTLTSDTFENKLTVRERRELESNFNINKSDYLLIYCGRLIPEKGIDKLIDAVNLIGRQDIKLLIIGESVFKNSAETPFVKSLKDKVSDKNNIIFTGFVDNCELYKYYSLANLQVIPSVCQEVAGIVAVEGRAVGLPQLVTRVGGLLEYAREDAIVVDADENLVKSLKREIENFANGKYKHIRFQPEKVDGQEEYYQMFVDVVE